MFFGSATYLGPKLMLISEIPAIFPASRRLSPKSYRPLQLSLGISCSWVSYLCPVRCLKHAVCVFQRQVGVKSVVIFPKTPDELKTAWGSLPRATLLRRCSGSDSQVFLLRHRKVSRRPAQAVTHSAFSWSTHPQRSPLQRPLVGDAETRKTQLGDSSSRTLGEFRVIGPKLMLVGS